MPRFLAALLAAGCAMSGPGAPTVNPGTPDARPVVQQQPDARPVASDQPDARPVGSDQPDARPVVADQPDAPPGTVDPCPIDQTQVRVSFPYVALTVPTVVDTVGTCYHSENGSVSQGWSSASLLDVIEDDATPALAVQNIAGLYFYFDFLVDQRAPSAGEIATLAAATGIPADLFGSSAGRLTTVFGATVTVHGGLPDGVSLQAFFPTSDSDTSYLRFSSDMDHLAALTGLMTGLADQELLVDAPMILAFGGGRTYTYTFRLTDHAAPRLTVSSIVVAGP
jgi:hypothetical protein